MTKRLLRWGMVWVVSLWWGTALLHAQTTEHISIQEMYDSVFIDFTHRHLKSDLISFFEKNFTELIDDIEDRATRHEAKQLIQFLKNEFNNYADAWPLKDHDPEEFNHWLLLKRKEYRTMILGKKIQALTQKGTAQKELKRYEKELEELLAKILEAKLAKEQTDIEGLESRLNTLKKMHQVRKKSKDKILQNRYDELIGNHHLYRW